MAPDASAFHYLSLAPSPDRAIAALDAPVANWFRETFGSPTPAQRFGWPALQSGDNLLLCAPTGTGKTLAAFLPLVSQLWDDRSDDLTCLYIAPMKALARDVAKTMRRCLRALEQQALAAGAPGPTNKRLRVGLRTGDTTADVRRRQLAKPPHILVTTPESLAIVLTHPCAQYVLASVRWIIVDEIHALASNKRGADLALSLERVEAFQRHGRRLRSATYRPVRDLLTRDNRRRLSRRCRASLHNRPGS